METNNTGLGLIKATIERVQKENSLFSSALKKLVNSSEEELNNFLKQKLEKKNENKILSLISAGEKIMLENSDGKATIACAKNIFKAHLHDNFKRLGLDTPGLATPEIVVDVHEIIQDANFSQIFNSLSSNLDELVLTQAQIIRFCEKHPTWLRQGGNITFFLTKVKGEYSVVSVSVAFSGLGVNVNRFESDCPHQAERRHRVVTPQLIPLTA